MEMRGNNAIICLTICFEGKEREAGRREGGEQRSAREAHSARSQGRTDVGDADSDSLGLQEVFRLF